jgi:hypothetical protein
MRESEFWQAVEAEFGAVYGRVVARDVVLEPVGGRSAIDAIAAGVPARRVWAALCDAQDVPLERRHGQGLRPPKN